MNEREQLLEAALRRVEEVHGNGDEMWVQARAALTTPQADKVPAAEGASVEFPGPAMHITYLSGGQQSFFSLDQVRELLATPPAQDAQPVALEIRCPDMPKNLRGWNLEDVWDLAHMRGFDAGRLYAAPQPARAGAVESKLSEANKGLRAATTTAKLPQEAQPVVDERERVEAVIACLGDDAAQLRQDNPEDERADNMDEAATLLGRLLTAPQPTRAGAVELSDTALLDWLETKTVNVRTPLRYGSRDMFWAGPSDDDGLPVKSDLRERIAKEVAAATTAATGGKINGVHQAGCCPDAASADREASGPTNDATGGKCPDGLTPDGPNCPRCGGKRGESGVDGGSWVHIGGTK